MLVRTMIIAQIVPDQEKWCTHDKKSQGFCDIHFICSEAFIAYSGSNVHQKKMSHEINTV